MASEGRYRTRLIESEETGSLEEFLYLSTTDDRSYVIVAPHGGGIEPNTDTLALQVTEAVPEASCWGCRGTAFGNAFERWHITSHEIPSEDWPLLNRLLEREYSMAVSVHGMVTRDHILVGGTAPKAQKDVLCAELEAALDVEAEPTSTGPHGGTHPDNPANQLSPTHFQLEFPMPLLNTRTDDLRTVLTNWLEDY